MKNVGCSKLLAVWFVEKSLSVLMKSFMFLLKLKKCHNSRWTNHCPLIFFLPCASGAWNCHLLHWRREKGLGCLNSESKGNWCWYSYLQQCSKTDKSYHQKEENIPSSTSVGILLHKYDIPYQLCNPWVGFPAPFVIVYICWKVSSTTRTDSHYAQGETYVFLQLKNHLYFWVMDAILLNYECRSWYLLNQNTHINRFFPHPFQIIGIWARPEASPDVNMIMHLEIFCFCCW